VPSGPNLFARLHKWAARQDENFLTEALAVVLEQLLILAPEVGVRLVSQLTGGFIEVNPESASIVEIRTQIETGQGRPDLEIRIPEHLVWVEVKAESELRAGQLEGYRVLPRESGIAQTRLVLLTRNWEVFQEDDTRPDVEVRWFELADWLESELPVIEAAGEVAGFLAKQFLGFLRGRSMYLTQVDWQMSEGVRALSNLLNMLLEAAAACKVPVKKSAGWDYSGIDLDGLKYWIGVFHDEPRKLWFGTRCRIDPEAAAPLEGGESGGPGRSDYRWRQYRWWRHAELYSEEVHFFSRSKGGQMQWLLSFLRECLEMAHSIETPDQPPIPEEPEES
jgi:hypothetical protein